MNLVANYTTIDVHQSNGILVTTSRNVAQVFEKNHKDVLRDIRAVLEANPDKVFTERNFAPSEYTDSTGRKLPEYLLTRDGTMLLIMGLFIASQICEEFSCPKLNLGVSRNVTPFLFSVIIQTPYPTFTALLAGPLIL